MTDVPIDLAAERLVRRVDAALFAAKPGECLLCYVGRLLDEFGCDRTLRFAKRYRDAQAPRAKALERRLGEVGGFCDCEIFLNGWTLHQRFWTSARDEVEDGIWFQSDPQPPTKAPPCATVRRGSTQPCTVWIRQRRGGYT